MIFDKVYADGFEQVVFCSDSRVGLKAIIALHSCVLGPATGGCRMWSYSSEEDALVDVLRLSKGMTYKASMAGLNWGGGKAVIIGNPKTDRTTALFTRFGEFVDRLGGNYITAKDVGTHPEDLKAVKTATPHVLGIEGEPGSSGDPSPATAFGVYHGLKAGVKHAFKTDQLKGMRIAIQGLGSVSRSLLKYLVEEGAFIIGCDVDQQAIDRVVRQYPIEIVSPESIYDVKCDVFAPSALGASINKQTLNRINAKLIAGAANNQLATPEDGFELMRRGMVYCPDYVINAGGLINIYYEDPKRGGYSKERAFDHVSQIGSTMKAILERAEAEKVPTHVIADKMAEERINQARLKGGKK